MQEGWLLGRVLGVVLHDKTRWVELFFALDLSLLINVGEPLVLLLDAAELNASCLSTLQEAVLGIRESDHQIKEIFLREAVAESRVFHARLVGLRGSEAHQNLIVAEVACCLQGEVLVPVLLGQTQRHLPIENQIQLAKVLIALNNRLICDEDAAVQLGDEESEELGACFDFRALLVLVAEYVLEVVDHGLE